MPDTIKTIEEKLTTVKTSLSNIKTSIVNKGQTPTGDITTYATAIDNISNNDSSKLVPIEVNEEGVIITPTMDFTLSLPENATQIRRYPQLDYLYSGNTSLVAVDFHQITSIGQTMKLTFSECTKLASVDFSNLKRLHPSECTFNRTFQHCKSLKSLSFPSLVSSNFESLLGEDVQDHFTNMLLNAYDCTVHFPSNLESVIGSTSDVEKGFGGQRITVLFDLPATT